MRYLYPALALLLGLILLGFGIGQLNADPETHTVETQGAEDAPFTVVSDDLIDSEEGFEEFTIGAEGSFPWPWAEPMTSKRGRVRRRTTE